MRSCPICRCEQPDTVRLCPECGRHLFAVEKSNLPVPWGVISLTLVACALLFFGNFRIVFGAGIVKRQGFGFDEPIASVTYCSSARSDQILAHHRHLCADLRNGHHLRAVPR